MVRVKLDGLSKYFGEVKAVDNLNLSIKDGEFVAFLGPSGCGKTTTLLMIAGIYRPTKGRIYFDDMDITNIAPKDRNVGMVFQSYALYPHMKVYDNIAFPLKLKKLPKNEIDRKVKQVAKLMQIDHLLDRYPRQLSGGQQQRVALARALVKDAYVLLMDEPLSNLDAKLRILMRAELKKLQKELEVTTIYVTHDQVEAMSMADRIAVMNEGRLQQYSTPDELYDKPANIFVAGFIGSPPMNLIDATFREDSGGYLVDAGSFKLRLEPGMGEVVKNNLTGQEIIFGARPENMEIVEAAEDNTIEGTVYVLEPLGRDLIVNVKVNDYMIKALTKPGVNLNPGDKVWLKVDLDKIHIFDKKTGKAVI